MAVLVVASFNFSQKIETVHEYSQRHDAGPQVPGVRGELAEGNEPKTAHPGNTCCRSEEYLRQPCRNCPNTAEMTAPQRSTGINQYEYEDGAGNKCETANAKTRLWPLRPQPVNQEQRDSDRDGY